MFVELRCMAPRGVSFSVGMGVFGVSSVEQEYEVVSKWKNPFCHETHLQLLRCSPLRSAGSKKKKTDRCVLRPDVRVGIWHSSEDHDASDAAGEKTACFPLLFAQHAASSSRHEGCCNIPRSKWSLPPRGGGDCFLVKSKHPGGNQEPEGGSSFSIAVPGRVFS